MTKAQTMWLVRLSREPIPTLAVNIDWGVLFNLRKRGLAKVQPENKMLGTERCWIITEAGRDALSHGTDGQQSP